MNFIEKIKRLVKIIMFIVEKKKNFEGMNNNVPYRRIKIKNL